MDEFYSRGAPLLRLSFSIPNTLYFALLFVHSSSFLLVRYLCGLLTSIFFFGCFLFLSVISDRLMCMNDGEPIS